MAKQQQVSIFKQMTRWVGRQFAGPGGVANPASWLTDLFLLSGGNKAKKAINEDTVMGIAAFFNGVQLIATGLASLPFSPYERMANKYRREAFEHPTYYLLHDEPNPFMSAMTFMETIILHVLLRGNGYATINRNNGFEVTGFNLKLPGTVQPWVFDGQLYYMVKDDVTKETKPMLPRDIIHIPGLGNNGITGKSVLQYARETLAGAIAVNDFGNEYFGNGGHPGYAVEVPGKLDPEKWRFVKETWQKKVANHEIAPLDAGMKMHKLGIPNNDAQFLESKRFNVEEIARILNLPLSKLKHSEKPSYNNVEQENINYVVDALRPWAKRVESEFRRKIFTEKERGRFTVKFNLESLMRGDMKTQAEYFQKMFYIGVYSPNDIRLLKNLSPREGGDEYFVQSNMTTTALLLQGEKNN